MLPPSSPTVDQQTNSSPPQLSPSSPHHHDHDTLWTDRQPASHPSQAASLTTSGGKEGYEASLVGDLGAEGGICQARQGRPTQHHPFLPLIHTPAGHQHPQLLHIHPITALAPAGLPTTQRSRVTATISRTPRPAPTLTSSRVDDSHDTPPTLTSDAHLAPRSPLPIYIYLYSPYY